jgi:hypothetical protein
MGTKQGISIQKNKLSRVGSHKMVKIRSQLTKAANVAKVVAAGLAV